MDPFTHAILGAAAALAVAPARHRRAAVLAGVGGGLLPDADIFIRSAADPMLAIEYHRHFTHSFALQPLLAVLAAALAWCLLRPFPRARTPLRALYLPALAGGISHVICDAWTSYGTRIWWPFSDQRVGLDWLSVIDPAFTLPLLVLVVIAFTMPRARWRWGAWAWVACYLSLAVVQQQRARSALDHWLAAEGRQPQRVTVKPSFGNIIVWRAILDEGDRFQALAIRPGLTGVGLRPGQSATRMEHDPDHRPPPAGSVQAGDIERFRHFSDNWLALVPGDGGRPVVGDMRYAMLPDRMGPLWGIKLAPERPQQHVGWVTFRSLRDEAWAELGAMIRGHKFD